MTQNQIYSLDNPAKAAFERSRADHPDRTFKSIHHMPARPKRRYVALFDDPQEKLPIKRIIVGPSLHQRENRLQIAKLLEGSAIPITCSETPFIG